MDRRAEPELMNTKDQVDSYSEADFSKGVVGQFFKSLGETSQLPSFFWLC